jgi:PAS domain S-box-containing protein
LADQSKSDARVPWAATGSLGTRIAAHNWSATPLGPIAMWPASLRTLVGLMLDSRQPMFMAWGPERTWLYNDAFIPIAGSKHPDCLGRPFDEVWAEAWPDLEKLFAQAWAGQAVQIDDLTLQLDRHGRLEEANFAFSYTPARLEDGSVGGLFGTCTETTEQVAANRALATGQQRLARLFEQSPSFMALLRGADHLFELANPRYLELVGRPVVGLTIAQALPDAVEQGYLDLLDSVYRSGKAYSAFGSKYAAQSAPGAAVYERYVDFVFQPILDGQGAVTGIFVEGVDVTERKAMEDALQRANETLERRVAERTIALQNIQTFYIHSSECHATLALRDDGRFEFDEINPATLRLYGMTREQVIGHTVDEIFEAQPARELTAHLMQALEQDEPYSYARSHGGSTVEAFAAPIPPAPGQRRRLAVTARDVTERKNLEEQLRQAQKMEAVGQLTGGLAHDFNNLLQGITGALDRVQAKIADRRFGEVDRFLNAAVESANRAAALTHRLLAFSRRQTLDPRPTDVNRLIGGMEELIRRTVGPGIAVEVVGAGGLWPTRIDAPQLESALLNLCINARDAMPDGGTLVIETANKWLDDRAATERDLPAGQYVSVCVSDTGTGMTPAVVERAFDPFFTTKPLGHGTGLGLSMIYGFARQSGGQVRIYTEVGKGTTMCLYLPRHVGAADEAQAAVDEQVGDHGTGETILIVDDETTIRMLVTEVLTEGGYRVIEAADGPSALKLLDKHANIALVITDVGLPGGLNGRQLADAVRAQRAEQKILFITGYAENAAISSGHLGHGMEILTKPFAMTALAAKVRKMLEA